MAAWHVSRRKLAQVAPVLMVLGAIASSIVVAAAFASNIVGTANNDVLRGTPGADKLDGKAGDDRLYGMAGNDTLKGGAGSDRFFCGAGRDKAVAEGTERVARDCEIVVRTVAPPSPTPPAPTPPAPTPPAPPPPPLALVGKYCGFTNSGGGICFDIGQTGAVQFFTKARFEQTTDCEPDSRFRLTITFGGQVPVTPDLKFSYVVGGGELVGSRIDGSVDTQGNAQGSLEMRASFDHEGTRYTCASTTTWTATLGR